MPIRDPIDALRRATKNSPWLVISILAHVILLVGLGLVMIGHQKSKRTSDGTIVIPMAAPRELPPEPEPEPRDLDRRLIPDDVPVEVIDFDTLVVLPMEEFPEPDLTQPIGDPNSIEELAGDPALSSSAIGVGIGGTQGYGPTAYTNPYGIRPTPGGPTGIPEGRTLTGEPLRIDKAVRAGLIWLCRHQNPDGSWSPRSMPERCDPSRVCYDPKLQANAHYDEGLTSLALLCFLGAGFTNTSKADLVDSFRGERHRLGEVVRNGLDWLRKRQNPDGSFSRDRAFMYNEALATMALSEAAGMTKNRYWGEPAQKAVNFIQAAQRPNPSGSGRWGWRYAARTDVEDFRKGTGDEEYKKELFDSDTSVTAWCVMALKSAQLSRLQVQKESMAGAMEFCKFATADDGRVGYLDAKGADAVVTGPFDSQFVYHPTTMSALGMSIRIFAEHDANDPFHELAAKRIVADLPTVTKTHDSLDYYYWYYASLALNQFDGPDSPRKSSSKYWRPWSKAMVDALLSLQDGTEHACTGGGWIASDRWASYSGAGPIYNTALNVLTLEVNYRYPNAFGRERD